MFGKNTRSREIISIGVGQCGLQSSAVVWRLYCLEHGISLDEGRMANIPEDESFMTFFRESDDHKFVPRAVMCDLEPTVMDNTFRNSSLKNLFAPEKLINCSEDAANVFARGKFAPCKPIHGIVLDQLRREIETCNCLNGIMIFNASGGGTGSGYVKKMTDELMPELKKNVLSLAFTVIPSKSLFVSTVEPYNHILYLAQTYPGGEMQMSVNFDNEAMYDFVPSTCGVTYRHVNHLIAHAASGFTTNLRFAGDLDCDISHFRTNLVPWEPVCHMIPRVSPLLNGKLRHNTQDITFDAFRTGKEFLSCDTRTGQYIAVCLQYRGLVKPRQVNLALTELKKETKFVKWMPTGFKVGLGFEPMSVLEGSPFEGVKRVLTKISNSSVFMDVINSIKAKYEKAIAMRAFAQGFISGGMEEGEFMEAVELVDSVLDAYKMATSEDGNEE